MHDTSHRHLGPGRTVRRRLGAVGAAAIAGTVLLALGSSSALAASGGCDIAATPLSFGTYSPMDTTSLASTATLTYQCDKSAQAKTIVIWIDKGLYAPSNTPRRMSSGSDYLNYNLFLDAAHTAVWGDPNPNQYIFSPANGVPYQVTIYGLVPADQDVSPGTYSDSLVVTLNW